MVVFPFNDFITFHNSLLEITSSPNVGSSKNNTIGLFIRDIAIDSFLWYPPDNVLAFCFNTSSNLNILISSSTFSFLFDIL